MTTTIVEYEYGNSLATQGSRPLNKSKTAHSTAAVIVGLLILAAAIVEAYLIWRTRAYIIRLNSFRAIDALMAPPNIQKELFKGIGISEVVLLVWAGFAWLGTALLGLSGLWTAARRRWGWRMLWTGAVATIVAGGLTIAGGYVLEQYAGFPPQAKRIYGIAFLIHSSPGWMILCMWLVWRLFLRQPVIRPEAVPAPQPESVAGTQPGTAE